MKKKKNHISIILLIIGLTIIVCNEFGVIKLISVYNERTEMQKEINQLVLEQNYLVHEIDKLTNDDDYIMKTARELFYMAKKGEKIYRIEQEKFIK
tara:strand:+ start:82 stop:369 length:288 start_codon:yes stop_codon:yes gene_type:complete